MRFVSNSSGLCLGNFRNAQEAIGASHEVVIDGVRRQTTAESYIVKPSIPIQFGMESLTARDIAAAKAGLKWRGLPTEGDGVTPIDPAEFGRIGVWDSVEWQKKYGLTDAEREEAEQMILNYPRNGIDYITVEETKRSAPWGTYDKTHHGRIAALADELGMVDQALDYERATKNRATVVSALEEKLAKSEPVGDVVLA